MQLDHERLDVYAVALDFAAWAYTVCRTLNWTFLIDAESSTLSSPQPPA